MKLPTALMVVTRSQRRQRAQRAAAGAATSLRKRATKKSARASKPLAFPTTPHDKGNVTVPEQINDASGASPAASEPPEAGQHGAGATSCSDQILINRAPVLTLWAAVAAQRQGFSFQEGLSFGREISGLLAQSKGRALGIYEAKQAEEERAERRRKEAQGVHKVEVFGMKLPAIMEPETGEWRAAPQGKKVDPGATQAYLERSFGPDLAAVKAAMESLVNAIPSQEIGHVAYKLYEHFRPDWQGWGQRGVLDLGRVRHLCSHWREA